MNTLLMLLKRKIAYSFLLILFWVFPNLIAQNIKLEKIKKINPTTVELTLDNNNRIYIDFYGNNIFRYFYNPNGGFIRKPEAKPEAEILVKNPRKNLSELNIKDNASFVEILTSEIKVVIKKSPILMRVTNLSNNKEVLKEIKPLVFEEDKYTLSLNEDKNEYFYGGGVQNGRFSHKGKKIAIVNQNSWTSGGVASPKPFYWSTNGYGIMCYTFKKGLYDFGNETAGKVQISHDSNYADIFFMIGEGATACLKNYYQLTGNPVLLPKFGFYEGHLNAYNRDYWKESEKGILFEDGKKYKESQKDNGGIKESLNGEKDNYQFSARAVIDRYKKHDMPLGWVLPNDGYGAGYGQTETLDGNIQNLKEFGDYARKNGVEIGLWTQSDLHPKEGISALLQRDIIKEVCNAGVRILKTDVAWVGAGYSFGLNGVADVGEIMPYYGNNCRPFIISLDGWAGTQRYAGIWTGDQTGGKWEYIRFHIPTYIGAGLSGQPNICSDMDGIFGGRNSAVNIRDFQWKTFTTMQLNMDGWGANPKYPHILGEPAASINRWYLKLKSQLMPYMYSNAKLAVDGLPINQAMFLQYPNVYTLGIETQYQFMLGKYILVAPIYQNTEADKKGNDIRNGIYLPEGKWIDYFSGDLYNGNCIINNYEAPIWKLPVFVKAGAIIPMNNANNNVSEINKGLRIYDVYPYNSSSFTEYNDDGISQEYINNKFTETLIESNVENNNLTITVNPTKGDFKGFRKNKKTELRINITKEPKKLFVRINNKKVKLKQVNSLNDYEKEDNVFYYNKKPNINTFATPNSEFAKKVITKNPVLLVKINSIDITKNNIKLTVKGYEYNPKDNIYTAQGTPTKPQKCLVAPKEKKPYSLKLSWDNAENTDFYEIEFNNMLYSRIKNNYLLFENLKPETKYNFKIRSANKNGYSDWVLLSETTNVNPLEFAIKDITGNCSVKAQGGFEIHKLFNFDEGDTWHTDYGAKADSFNLVIDLHTINKLDKFEYLPRSSGYNGIILKGSVAVSMDKNNWIEAGNFKWDRDNATKTFDFKSKPIGRYIKIFVEKGFGHFGSGRELYVFKVPETETMIPGDINHDGKIDNNDLTSYINYTGLRKGDNDFDGYISKGDINQNNLIDAYDISLVATRLGKIKNNNIPKISGNITFKTNKKYYKKNDIIEITVSGKDLKSVNAISFALPYNTNNVEYIETVPLAVKDMRNMTYDRLHSNGKKSLYPTFVNIGDKKDINGNNKLFIIKLKAKKNINFKPQIIDGILVDKNLNSIKF